MKLEVNFSHDDIEYFIQADGFSDIKAIKALIKDIKNDKDQKKIPHDDYAKYLKEAKERLKMNDKSISFYKDGELYFSIKEDEK